MGDVVTMADQMRVPGHTLQFEGAPHDDTGERRSGILYAATKGPGRAKCSCGQMSEWLPTTAARRRWHRDTHKADIVARRGGK